MCVGRGVMDLSGGQCTESKAYDIRRSRRAGPHTRTSAMGDQSEMTVSCVELAYPENLTILRMLCPELLQLC
jgi:hypothetical protein